MVKANGRMQEKMQCSNSLELNGAR